MSSHNVFARIGGSKTINAGEIILIIFGSDGERLRAEWTTDRNVGHHCTSCGAVIAQDAPAIEPTKAFTGFALCNEDCLDEHNETEEADYERLQHGLPAVVRELPEGVSEIRPDVRTHSVLLGHQIRELRMSRGWLQADLAKRAGLQRPIVSRAESGKHYLTMRTLCRYAEALEVSLYEIVRVIDPFPLEVVA